MARAKQIGSKAVQAMKTLKRKSVGAKAPKTKAAAPVSAKTPRKKKGTPKVKVTPVVEDEPVLVKKRKMSRERSMMRSLRANDKARKPVVPHKAIDRFARNVLADYLAGTVKNMSKGVVPLLNSAFHWEATRHLRAAARTAYTRIPHDARNARGQRPVLRITPADFVATAPELRSQARQ